MALKISVVLLQLKFLGIVPVTRFTEKSGADPGFHEGGGGQSPRKGGPVGLLKLTSRKQK